MLSVYRNAMENPVAFYSRQFKDVETHYAATEPTVCLWWSRSDISRFTYTDGPLSFRQITKPESLLISKMPNHKLTRWSLYLQEFQLKITYRPGNLTANADRLSHQAWEGKNDVDKDIHA